MVQENSLKMLKRIISRFFDGFFKEKRSQKHLYRKQECNNLSYEDQTVLSILKEIGKASLYEDYGSVEPASIVITNKYLYETFDENNKLHSYNGLPASILYRETFNVFDFLWYEHGVLHRESGLPVIIRESRLMCHLAEGDFLDKLVNEETACFVRGHLHNRHGFATSLSTQKKPSNSHAWALYGLQVSKKTFSKAIQYHKAKKVPLWVAFLRIIGMVSEDSIRLFKDDDNIWDASLPLLWVLRAWGIDEETFETKCDELKGTEFFQEDSYINRLTFDGIVKVAEYEKSHNLDNLQS